MKRTLSTVIIKRMSTHTPHTHARTHTRTRARARTHKDGRMRHYEH